MSYFFIHLYRYFKGHKAIFYSFLLLNVVVIGFFASKLQFEENIVSFFPDTKDSKLTEQVFGSLKIKDKIIIFLSSKDSVKAIDSPNIIEASEQLKSDLEERLKGSLIKDVFSEIDKDAIKSATNLIYDNLPIFLNEEDYVRLDTLLTPQHIDEQVAKNYTNLVSPAGFVLKSFILRDPLGIGSNALRILEDFKVDSNYEIVDNHIFSDDGENLLMFISPTYSLGHTGQNEHLIEVIEDELSKISSQYDSIEAQYFGGPSVGVYNAKQIKEDTIITSVLALIVIVILISSAFKRKRSILLIITPVIYGVLFSLCLIYFLKGSISLIAIGAGSAVIGIALSYSIHMLAHQNHVSNIEQLIKELASPLTIGSFTTIGAFMGLLFTSSPILQDFGLFTSLALIGTTLFCLVFLPQFLKGQSHMKKGRFLHFIERINGYAFEKNKWLIIIVCVVTAICFITSQRVKFNEDMMSINYFPEHLKQAEEKLLQVFEKQKQTVLFVSVGNTYDEAVEQYDRTNSILEQLKGDSLIEGYASANRFFLTQNEQRQKIERWNQFWSDEKSEEAKHLLRDSSKKYGFKEGSFKSFYNLINHEFVPFDYEEAENSTLLREWVDTDSELTMLISQVRLSKENKEAVYAKFKDEPRLVVFDRAYLASHWVKAINDDFDLILFISSVLVFITLWVSYGRIELALMSFMPMFLTWFIILGFMGIFGIEFNIINIILSTFIFGIGDDFSIFIMDGLLKRYGEGEKIINSHKTAIFFSAITIIIGMGVLVFAKHPAIQSISIISILGIISVVLVSFILQPVVFNIFIAKPASKGLPPYTLLGLMRNVVMFLLFIVGCLLIKIYILLLYITPISRRHKQYSVCYLMHLFCRALLKIALFAKKDIDRGESGELNRPAIIIANHQSFIDILMLISLSPKILLVTNQWVWNSPFFGSIIRYAGFIYNKQGYEESIDLLKQKVELGYSIAIFPEGTRSVDGSIKRFHKGAFYFAKQLKLDIIPILLYGNNQVICKRQPLNIRKGELYCKVYPRVLYSSFEQISYQELSKQYRQFFIAAYRNIEKQKVNANNSYYYENLVQNYIYKGPVIEWYIRVKVKMEKNYRLFDELIPKQGQITDIGCGLGPLCYMLSMLAPERQLLGIDYDEGKIAIAKHGWLHTKRTQFVAANAVTYDYPMSDVFIMNDMLHYLSPDDQFTLVQKCAKYLLPGGMIIIRDGNTEKVKKHKVTKFTEVLSTKTFKFNKTDGELSFMSEQQIRGYAKACNLTIELIPNDKYTSNTIYLLRR